MAFGGNYNPIASQVPNYSPQSLARALQRNSRTARAIRVCRCGREDTAALAHHPR